MKDKLKKLEEKRVLYRKETLILLIIL